MGSCCLVQKKWLEPKTAGDFYTDKHFFTDKPLMKAIYDGFWHAIVLLCEKNEFGQETVGDMFTDKRFFTDKPLIKSINDGF